MNDEEDREDPQFPFPDGTYVLIQNYDGETSHPWNGKMVRFIHEGAEWEPDTERWLFKAMKVEGHDLPDLLYNTNVALFAEEMIEADLVPSLNKVW